MTDWRTCIDQAVVNDRLRWRLHATDRMRGRDVAVAAVIALLRQKDIVETDDARRPFPTAVLLGQIGGRLLHVVVGWQADSQVLHVITVYDPDEVHFDQTGRNRRR